MSGEGSTIGRRKFLYGAGVVGTTALAAPHVLAKKRIQWKMVTTWPKNFPGVGTGAERLAQYIQRLSNGRLQVRVYGAGELVPAMGVFDAVQRGTAEMGHAASYYWKGKHEGAQFFGAVPFGLTASEMSGWLNYGGGQKLWDELYRPFGLRSFSAGNTGTQMGGWFKKEIKNINDFKGLRMRMPGLGGEVLNQLNCAIVNLPGGEIFQALKKGTIDATEWIGPYNDLAFGLHQAANYYYWPGWHEPSANLEALINVKAFEKLPSDLKQVVQLACQAAAQDVYAEFSARNAEALATLVKKYKVELKKFPDPVLKKIGEVSRDMVSAVAKKDPLSQKIHRSYEEYQRKSIQWGKISEQGYQVARSAIY